MSTKITGRAAVSREVAAALGLLVGLPDTVTVELNCGDIYVWADDARAVADLLAHLGISSGEATDTSGSGYSLYKTPLVKFALRREYLTNGPAAATR